MVKGFNGEFLLKKGESAPRSMPPPKAFRSARIWAGIYRADAMRSPPHRQDALKDERIRWEMKEIKKTGLLNRQEVYLVERRAPRSLPLRSAQA